MKRCVWVTFSIKTLQGNCTGICHCVFVTSSFPDFNIMFILPLEALNLMSRRNTKGQNGYLSRKCFRGVVVPTENSVELCYWLMSLLLLENLKIVCWLMSTHSLLFCSHNRETVSVEMWYRICMLMMITQLPQALQQPWLSVKANDNIGPEDPMPYC